MNKFTSKIESIIGISRELKINVPIGYLQLNAIYETLTEEQKANKNTIELFCTTLKNIKEV
jgi:hypothetical protein